MHHTKLVSLTIALTTLVSTAVGCSAAPYEEEEGSTSARIVGGNARTAFDYFVARGLSDVQAAAIVGNLQKESTAAISPVIAEPGGAGRGIAQWSVGGRWDTSSRDNLRWYAAQHQQSMTSLDAQLAFVWYELQTFPNYRLAQLRAAQTIESAVNVFEHGFEQCGTCDEPRRLQFARTALSSFGHGASSAAPPSSSSSGKSGSSSGDPPSTGKPSGTDPSSDPPSTGKPSDPPADPPAGDDGSSGKPDDSK